LLSKFAITLGDEFQGILSDPSILPDVIWDVANIKGLPALRLGIGYGRIDTEIPLRAINLDGPALHRARAAIEKAKSEKLLGGVFLGFGADIDAIANGFARLLHFHISKRSETQRLIMGLLREGHTQIEIANIIHRTPQAVNDHKNAAGFQPLRRELRPGFRCKNPGFQCRTIQLKSRMSFFLYL
jgi:hypothetical protein